MASDCKKKQGFRLASVWIGSPLFLSRWLQEQPQLWTSPCHCHGSWKLCRGSKAQNYRTIHSVFPHIVPQGYFLSAAQDTLMVSSKPSPAQAGKAGCFAHLLCFIHRVHMSFLRLNPGSTWSPWAVCQLFPRQWGFYPLFILCRLG